MLFRPDNGSCFWPLGRKGRPGPITASSVTWLWEWHSITINTFDQWSNKEHSESNPWLLSFPLVRWSSGIQGGCVSDPCIRSSERKQSCPGTLIMVTKWKLNTKYICTQRERPRLILMLVYCLICASLWRMWLHHLDLSQYNFASGSYEHYVRSSA